MNEQNLMPIQEVNSRRSREEHIEDSRKGGIASGKARREMKVLRDHLNQILDEEVEFDGEIVSKRHVIALKAVEQIFKEDITPRDFARLFEVIRDTIGEKPIDKVQVSELDQATIDEIEAMVAACAEEPVEWHPKHEL